MAGPALPTRSIGPATAAAAELLDQILADMAERSVRPGQINILAAATDKGAPTKTLKIVARLAERRLKQAGIPWP